MTNKVQKIREGIEKLKSQLIRGACSSQIAMETRCKEEAYDEVLALLNTMQKEPVSERFAFKAIPRLLEMIEPTDRAKAYTAKLADAFEVQGYSTDAKIVRESIKVMNGDKVPLATMDEEPASEELKEAAKLHVIETRGDDVVWDENARCTMLDFKAGAKWQKEKDESITEDLGEYINELSKQFPEVSFAKLSRIAVRVAKWQKEQILKAMDLGEPPYLISVEQAYYNVKKMLEDKI